MSAIGFPIELLQLFAPRPLFQPIQVVHRRKFLAYSGLHGISPQFEKNTPEKIKSELSSEQLKQKKLEEKAKLHRLVLEKQLKEYEPFNDADAKRTINPEKTVFVGRLSYETTAKSLYTVFEVYGAIHDLRLVFDHTNKPRGYAFIEFTEKQSAQKACAAASKMIVDGRRVIVDHERSRIQKNWLPRRLGMGEGESRVAQWSKKLLRMKHRQAKKLQSQRALLASRTRPVYKPRQFRNNQSSAPYRNKFNSRLPRSEHRSFRQH